MNSNTTTAPHDDEILRKVWWHNEPGLGRVCTHDLNDFAEIVAATLGENPQFFRSFLQRNFVAFLQQRNEHSTVWNIMLPSQRSVCLRIYNDGNVGVSGTTIDIADAKVYARAMSALINLTENFPK